MIPAGHRSDDALGLLGTLHMAVALPAAVLLAGRMPGGHAFGAVLAALMTGVASVGAYVRARTRGAARGSRGRSVPALGIGAAAGAVLAFGPSLPPPAVMALVGLIGCAAAAAPRATPVGTVIAWSVGPSLSVFLALLAGPGASFAAIAALNAAALALLAARPSATRLPGAAQLTALWRRVSRPATEEPWPAGRRRWVHQRTP